MALPRVHPVVDPRRLSRPLRAEQARHALDDRSPAGERGDLRAGAGRGDAEPHSRRRGQVRLCVVSDGRHARVVALRRRRDALPDDFHRQRESAEKTSVPANLPPHHRDGIRAARERAAVRGDRLDLRAARKLARAVDPLGAGAHGGSARARRRCRAAVRRVQRLRPRRRPGGPGAASTRILVHSHRVPAEPVAASVRSVASAQSDDAGRAVLSERDGVARGARVARPRVGDRARDRAPRRVAVRFPAGERRAGGCAVNDAVLEIVGAGKSYRDYSSTWWRAAGWLTGKPSHFFDNWVLRDISLAVRRGEALGVVGRNGAGKSTLLKLVAGTLTATEGSVVTRGRVSAILELGMGFNPEFSARDNARHACGLQGYSRAAIDQMLPWIESFADVGAYFDQPVRTFSSGMTMRVAFAVATARRPDILIVDEALSVGDAAFQR